MCHGARGLYGERKYKDLLYEFENEKKMGDLVGAYYYSFMGSLGNRCIAFGSSRNCCIRLEGPMSLTGLDGLLKAIR